MVAASRPISAGDARWNDDRWTLVATSAFKVGFGYRVVMRSRRTSRGMAQISRAADFAHNRGTFSFEASVQGRDNQLERAMQAVRETTAFRECAFVSVTVKHTQGEHLPSTPHVSTGADSAGIERAYVDCRSSVGDEVSDLRRALRTSSTRRSPSRRIRSSYAPGDEPTGRRTSRSRASRHLERWCCCLLLVRASDRKRAHPDSPPELPLSRRRCGGRVSSVCLNATRSPQLPAPGLRQAASIVRRRFAVAAVAVSACCRARSS